MQRNAKGQPLASPELVVVASLAKKSNGLDANVEIRGVGEHAWEVHPNVKIVAGRRFTPGLRELIVGKGAHEQFRGLDLGSTLKLNGQEWTVVGEFESGDAHDSELWADTDVVGSTYRRGASTTAVVAKLTSPAAFDALKASVASDPRLKLDVQTTRAYYSAQSERLSTLISILGMVVGVIMAIGAVFGALNTMYAAVASRGARDRDAARHRLPRRAGGRLGAARDHAAGAARRGASALRSRGCCSTTTPPRRSARTSARWCSRSTSHRRCCGAGSSGRSPSASSADCSRRCAPRASR